MKRLLLIVLFCTQFGRVYAASTPDHFLQSFLLTGYSVAAISDDKEVILWSAISGGVIGILPDVIGAFGPHSSTNPLRFIPQYGFHLLVDGAFHRFEGDTWWPRMAGVCVVMWIAEGVLTYVFFRYVL